MSLQNERTDVAARDMRLPEGYRVFVTRATAHAAASEAPAAVLGLGQDRHGLPAYQKCGGGRRVIRKRIGNS